MAKELKPIGIVRESIDESSRIPDYNQDITQEGLESLRAEFMSLGGIVDTLPEVSSVRDWTIVAIREDISKSQVIDLYIMVDGVWQSLIDIQAIGQNVLRASGDAGSFNVDAELTISAVDTPAQLIDGNADKTIWTLHNKENLEFNSGIFTVLQSGYYNVQWSISFTSAGSNKVYECGLYANGIDTERGYAKLKITTSGDVVSFSSTASNYIDKGIALSLYITNLTDGVNFIVQHASFTIHRIR